MTNRQIVHRALAASALLISLAFVVGMVSESTEWIWMSVFFPLVWLEQRFEFLRAHPNPVDLLVSLFFLWLFYTGVIAALLVGWREWKRAAKQGAPRP